VAKAALGEIHSEWKTYLGACNFTLPYQILYQLCEIADPCTCQTRPRPAAVPLPAGPELPARPALAGFRLRFDIVSLTDYIHK
jgi:hypothetical protein